MLTTFVPFFVAAAIVAALPPGIVADDVAGCLSACSSPSKGATQPVFNSEGTVCCAASCGGKCGGTDCWKMPGGPEACCVTSIIARALRGSYGVDNNAVCGSSVSSACACPAALSISPSPTIFPTSQRSLMDDSSWRATTPSEDSKPTVMTTTTPTIIPTSLVEKPQCRDNSEWHVDGMPHKTCAFVAKRSSTRCTSPLFVSSPPFIIPAAVACPLSCGSCTSASPTANPTLRPTVSPSIAPTATLLPTTFPTERPTSSSPSSSPTYKPTSYPSLAPTPSPTSPPTCTDDEDWAFGPNRDCGWIAIKPSTRCRSSYTDPVQGTTAFESCPLTCGGCILPTPDPSPSPTSSPTFAVTTIAPTTMSPSRKPTSHPTVEPSAVPTKKQDPFSISLALPRIRCMDVKNLNLVIADVIIRLAVAGIGTKDIDTDSAKLQCNRVVIILPFKAETSLALMNDLSSQLRKAVEENIFFLRVLLTDDSVAMVACPNLQISQNYPLLPHLPQNHGNMLSSFTPTKVPTITPSKSPTLTPSISSTLAPSTTRLPMSQTSGISTPGKYSCVNSKEWLIDPKRDCAWVSKKPKVRCDKKNKFGIPAALACPMSCSSCPPTISPTSSPSHLPTITPTLWAPSAAPTGMPTTTTDQPTEFPTPSPSKKPTGSPTETPSKSPTSPAPTILPTASPTALPSATPTPEPTVDPCHNSKHWSAGPGRDCDWIGLKPGSRCSTVDKSGVEAYDACLIACDTCPTDSPTTTTSTPIPTSDPTIWAPTSKPSHAPSPQPTELPCQDSETWRTKTGRNCDWIALKPALRCAIKGKSTVKTAVLAYNACFISCGTCPTIPPSASPTTTTPTSSPTLFAPTSAPSESPTTKTPTSQYPTKIPTRSPTTNKLTMKPSETPTRATTAPSTVPSSIPTIFPTTTPCRDSDKWFLSSDTKIRSSRKARGCDWVALKPSQRCKKLNAEGISAYNACYTACNSCITPSPSSAPSGIPTQRPTSSPTFWAPSAAPTGMPTTTTDQPTEFPTPSPSKKPTGSPTETPSKSPTSPAPTILPTASPTALPSATPTPEPTVDPCHNSKHWSAGPGRDCDWIGLKPGSRCSTVDKSGVEAYDACLIACDTCPTDSPTTTTSTPIPTSDPTIWAPTSKPSHAPSPQPTELPCQDSETWRTKTGRNCDWIALKPALRCAIKGKSTVKTAVLAYNACFISCGTCPTIPPSASPTTTTPTSSPTLFAPTSAPSLKPTHVTRKETPMEVISKIFSTPSSSRNSSGSLMGFPKSFLSTKTPSKIPTVLSPSTVSSFLIQNLIPTKLPSSFPSGLPSTTHTSGSSSSIPSPSPTNFFYDENWYKIVQIMSNNMIKKRMGCEWVKKLPSKRCKARSRVQASPLDNDDSHLLLARKALISQIRSGDTASAHCSVCMQH